MTSGLKVRVRFAPSPTGFLHVGGLRTALFNFLFARKNRGSFILRIEDTDKSREVAGATENIIETLKFFKLDFDEGPVFQSQRLEIYKKHIAILLEKGAVYKCYCSTERIEELKKQADAQKVPFRYDKHCLRTPPNPLFSSQGGSPPEADGPSSRGGSAFGGRAHASGGNQRGGSGGVPFVVRQNMPEEGHTEFEDLVHGKIRVENRFLDDGILIKSDGWPVYNFANVVDDHLMQISHVIRGEEFISSTPKHILLYQAFGWQPPKFAHLPLLLDKNRHKLSKRTGDVAVKEYLDKGYLPEAILNFVAFLGWNPKTEQEIFSLEQLTEAFDLTKINKAGAIFDLEKLKWFNKHYLKEKPIPELTRLVRPYLPLPQSLPSKFVQKIIELEKERLTVLNEIGERVGYFFREPEYEVALLIWKETSKDKIKANLLQVIDFIDSDPLFNSPPHEGERGKGVIEIAFKKFIDEKKMVTGEVLWPLRVALTGLQASPGPFEIMEAFLTLRNGKEIILQRIKNAIEKL